MSDLKKTRLSTVKRLGSRGRYDRETLDAILDAGLIAHIGHIVDGKPVVIPTAYWREGDHVYWHGSSKSRMIRTLEQGAPACFEVTLVDGLVVARSAFHKSINFRSVMLFGTPFKVTDTEEKLARLKAFVERIYPGRWDELRPVTRQELKATSVLGMTIDEGAAKVRTGPPVDDEADYALPIWAGVIPVKTSLGKPVDDGRLAQGTGKPPRVRL
jgi:nitroimidazol reductase NimA-like FMN-containing flavoprotein (pyridoxamine 5'-phosphate oxidase superfamily)